MRLHTAGVFRPMTGLRETTSASGEKPPEARSFGGRRVAMRCALSATSAGHYAELYERPPRDQEARAHAPASCPPASQTGGLFVGRQKGLQGWGRESEEAEGHDQTSARATRLTC